MMGWANTPLGILLASLLINRLNNRPMEDIVIGLLLVLDFQLYVMAMRARSNEELIRLVIIDLFIWALAIANQ